jgi:internalin A
LLALDNNQICDISPLANLTNLTLLVLSDNQISDISVLAGLTALTELRIGYNQISDISPLVQNAGFATGDYVSLSGNPLSSDSINICIPQLQARGVTVYY